MNLPPRPERKEIPPRKENILEKTWHLVPMKKRMEWLKDDWNELAEKYDDLDVIFSTLEDDHFASINTREGYAKVFYEEVLKLVENSTLTKNKEKVQIELQKQIEKYDS